jgi:hypothetical protein
MTCYPLLLKMRALLSACIRSGRKAYELRRLENVLTTVVITLESAIDWFWLGKKVLDLFLGASES